MNYDKQCHAMEGEPQHRQGPMYYDATRSQEHSELVVGYIDPFLQIQPAMPHDTTHRKKTAMAVATAQRQRRGESPARPPT